VTPRTVAAAIAKTTSADAGRGPLIAEPLSHAADVVTEIITRRLTRKSDPRCSMGQEPINRRSGHVRALCQEKLR